MKRRALVWLCTVMMWITALLSVSVSVSADTSRLDISVTTDKASYNAGEVVTVTTTLKNNGTDVVSGLRVTVETAAQLISLNGDDAVVPTVSSGATATVVLKLRAIEGGRPMIRVRVCEGNGQQMFEKQWDLSVNGAGWYAGDSHSHSTYSDGANTIAANCESAYKEGLSWLYSTDHNNMAQYKEAAGVNASYTAEDFLNLAGNEFTSQNRGHTLGYRLPYSENSNFTTGTPGGGGWYIDELGSSGQNWQTVIDTVNGWGGIFYAAHPNGGSKASQRIEWSFDEVYKVTGMTGIEVWNASQIFSHPQNVGAFKIWDTLNVRGDKLLGIANSDGHGVPDIGSAHIKGYLTSLTRTNIDNLLAGGSFYGTNGPDLWFDINGIGMGQTLKIKGDSAQAHISITASDDNYPLTKVILYKLHVTGEISDEAAAIDYQYSDNGFLCDVNYHTDTKETVKTWELTGQNQYRFSAALDVTVRDGDFFRIEVQSEKNAHYDNNVAGAQHNGGFAYSNPIWVETADKANDVYIKAISLSVDGATVRQTRSGQYYVAPEQDGIAMSASDLKVTLGGSAKLTAKTYNADKQMFELMLTAEDGSTKNLAIYVAAQPAPTADFSRPFVPQNAAAPTTATTTTTSAVNNKSTVSETVASTNGSGTASTVNRDDGGDAVTDTAIDPAVTTASAVAPTDADDGSSLPSGVKILLIALPILLILSAAAAILIRKYATHTTKGEST